MLTLSILFTSVSLLLIYSLMRDTGQNTAYARNSGITSDASDPNDSRQPKNPKPAGIIGFS